MTKALRIFIAVILIFLLVVYISGTLAALATNEHKMLEKFEQYADTSVSSIPKTEYPRLAHAIAGYLSGSVAAPQIEVQKHGRVVHAFSERELLHLKDIRALVALSGQLRWAAIALVALLAGVYFYAKKKKVEVLTASHAVAAVRVASGVLLTVLAAILIWGLLGFDSLFLWFHKLLFRNDLWLLDPETDVLLQLMPQPFFVSYAWDLLKQNAFILLMLLLTLFGLRANRGESR